MSHQTDRTFSETPPSPVNPIDHVPSWLSLWMPIAVMIIVWAIGKIDLDFYQTYIGTESGVLEFSHIVLPLLSAYVCIRILSMPAAREDRLVFAWVVLALVGSIYMAGEEASWGQHIGGWLTPDFWQGINDQGETNLHNTSSWLDQKPRTLLEIGIIVGVIIIPLLALKYPQIRSGRFAVFLPPMACLPIGVLAEFSRVWERLYKHDIIHFEVFVRASELQEFYFSLFIFVYLLVFQQRIAAR
ncbi:MAG TPA: hypothetical protein VK862_11845 [Afifellaceae bacterium]|nr:hypothetical protein [Afifellaceae bacterium]